MLLLSGWKRSSELEARIPAWDSGPPVGSPLCPAVIVGFVSVCDWKLFSLPVGIGDSISDEYMCEFPL